MSIKHEIKCDIDVIDLEEKVLEKLFWVFTERSKQTGQPRWIFKALMRSFRNSNLLDLYYKELNHDH